MSQTPLLVEGWQYDKKGLLPAILKKRSDIKLPELRPDQILIKVYAASINPVDWKLAALVPRFFVKLPKVAAHDFAGEVIQVSNGKATQTMPWLQPGAKVYGMLPAAPALRTGLGTLSTYTIADANLIAPIPDFMTPVQAADITLAGLTAISMSVKVKKGDKVLVLGGSTAVGLLLTQMIKAEGVAKVVATASGQNINTILKYGVDETVDYRATDANQELKRRYVSDPFDLILDCVGSASTFYAFPAFLKPGGVFYNIGASDLDPANLIGSAFTFTQQLLRCLIWPRWLGGTPRKYVPIAPDHSLMPKLGEYIDSGKVKPKNDSVFEFDGATKAYELLMKGRAVGKIVVKVDA